MHNILLLGWPRIAPFCLGLPRIAPDCLVLPRFAPFCPVLPRIAPDCPVLAPDCFLSGASRFNPSSLDLDGLGSRLFSARGRASGPCSNIIIPCLGCQMASPHASSKFQISDATNATEEEERALRLLIGTSNSTIAAVVVMERTYKVWIYSNNM